MFMPVDFIFCYGTISNTYFNTIYIVSDSWSIVG